jgi:serine/threonine-protein kinase
VLTYVDTRNAKEHGKITGQSPAENMEVMLDSEVSLSVYRYPTDKADFSFRVRLRKSDEDVALRVTLKADDSDFEIEAYTHTYPSSMDREQPVTVNLPDNRHYTCTVYQNGEPMEPFEIPNT